GASELRRTGGGMAGHTTWTPVVAWADGTSGQGGSAVYPSLARLGARCRPRVSRWRWPPCGGGAHWHPFLGRPLQEASCVGVDRRCTLACEEAIGTCNPGTRAGEPFRNAGALTPRN